MPQFKYTHSENQSRSRPPKSNSVCVASPSPEKVVDDVSEEVVALSKQGVLFISFPNVLNEVILTFLPLEDLTEMALSNDWKISKAAEKAVRLNTIIGSNKDIEKACGSLMATNEDGSFKTDIRIIILEYRLSLMDNAAVKDQIRQVANNNTSMTELSLVDNSIGAAGVQAFAQALRTNWTLINLELRCNNIGATGAQFLARLLRRI